MNGQNGEIAIPSNRPAIPAILMRPRRDILSKLQLDRTLPLSFFKSEQSLPLHPGLRSPGFELKRVGKFSEIDAHSTEMPAEKHDRFSTHDTVSGDEFRCENDSLNKPQLFKLQPISKQGAPAHPNSKFKSPSCNARSKSFCVQDTRVSKSNQQKRSPEVLFDSILSHDARCHY